MQAQIIVYVIVMLITLLFFWSNDNKQDKKTGIIMITAILTCFSGFRSWWIGDLIKYYTLYYKINVKEGFSAVTEKNVNIGIRLFFWGAGQLGISYDVCIFLISLFSAVTLAILIYKYSPAPYWSYLMYLSVGFYLFTYTGLKQTIAMGFVILAVMQIFENNWKKFIFWVIIAGLFHAPSLILLPAYFVAKRKNDRNFFVALVLFLILGYIYQNEIVSWFAGAYYEGEKGYSANETIGGRVIVMVLIILLGIFLRPSRDETGIYSKVLNLMIMAAAIQYFSIYNNVFTRLADYYYQFVVLFIPLILETGDHQIVINPEHNYKVVKYNKDVYVLLSFGITIFSIWFYFTSTLSNTGLIEQYKFFWEIDPYELYF